VGRLTSALYARRDPNCIEQRETLVPKRRAAPQLYRIKIPTGECVARRMLNKKAGMSAGRVCWREERQSRSIFRYDRRATPAEAIVDARRDHINI
jgi:hypothetical protein